MEGYLCAYLLKDFLNIMSWKKYFNTSVGKKLQMAFTGLFLIVFLVVHAYINAQIWWGKEAFLDAAHFMGTNVVIRATEFILFGALFVHIFQGFWLWAKQRTKRSTPYAYGAGKKSSPWYRRSMAILGTLILLFLIIHLRNFWVPNRYSQTFHGHELDLYTDMKEHFSNIWMVLLYVGGCVALAWHLVHGFYSAFQTLGLATHRYKNIINSVGIAFSILIPLIFALMPVYFYLASVGYIELI
jgi:succinate dehydrogenase / fumarate reductase, cytochrome b subunit